MPTSAGLDVNAVNQGAINEIAAYYYESLFDRDQDGKINPLLVRSAEVSADGRIHTWRLQSNVKFHDGSTFNAAAVKWNLERKAEKKQVLADLIPISSIETPDDLTVRVTLSRPMPGIYGFLASKTFSMYSPTFSERVGDDGLKTQASGTGPFKVAEYRTNEVLRLVRNENYWQPGLPYLDEIVLRIVPDSNARATMLQAGDVDMARDLSLPDIQRLKTARGFTVQEGGGSVQYYVTLNNKRPPLDDVKVRQALNYAVDKEGIIKTVFLGFGRIATAPYLNSAVDGFTSVGSYPYDPARAKALLDEAGWREGPGGIRQKDGRTLQLELVTRKGGAAGDYETSELIQGFLKQVGVDVKLTVEESATFVSRVTKPYQEATYDMVALTFGTFQGDAEYTIRTAMIESSFAPRYYNRAYYTNPVVERLVEQSLQAPNRQARDQIYAEILKQAFQDAPIIQLFDAFTHNVVSDKVHGVYLDPAGTNWTAKYAWKAR